MDNSLPTAFSYNRKSTEDSKRQIQSIDDQVRINKANAERWGYQVIQEFRESKSAKVVGRPEFNHMIELIKKGMIHAIFVWNADRLARNGRDAGEIVDLLTQGCLKTIYTSDRVYTVSDIQMLYIDFGYSNQYIVNLSKGVKRGLVSRTMKGYATAIAKTGYEKFDQPPLKGLFRPHPTYFYYFQKAWKMLIYENYHPKEILEYLNKNDVKQPSGRKVLSQDLSKMFHDRFFAGLIKLGELKDQVGVHEPMVTLEEYEKAQTLLYSYSKKKHKRESTFNPDFPLNKTLKCSNCLHYMSGSFTKNRYGYLYGRYNCYNRNCVFKDRLNRDDIEPILYDLIKKISFTKETEKLFKDKLTKKLSVNFNYEIEKKHKVDSLKAFEVKEKRLDSLVEDGVYTIQKYKIKVEEVQVEMKKIKTDIQNLDYTYNNITKIVKEGSKYLRDLDSLYMKIDIRDKYKINQSLFPDGITKHHAFSPLLSRKNTKEELEKKIDIFKNLSNMNINMLS